MLKYTSSVLATISLALVFGCGGDETTENGTPTAPPSEPAQVKRPAAPDFFEAIRNNNVASIKQQLADGVDPESLDQELQMSPLAMAAAVGSEEITRLLLDAGANVDVRNTDGTTPLATAVFFGHPEVVKLLLEEGADPAAQNLKGEKASDYVTQPMPDGILQLIGGLIRVRVDPVAAKQSIPAIAALLGVEPGSAAAAAGPLGKSIWDAAAAGDLELLQANLKVGNDINAMVPAGLPGAGGTPLHIAAMSNQVEVIEFLLGKGADVNIKAGDENGSTPLQWAAVFGKYEAVKALVEIGKADVNARDNNNATALDALPFDITFGTDPTISVDKPKIKTYLMAKGAKPGAGAGLNPASPTPSSSAKDIWTAAAEGNVAAIQAHLDAGVDINAR
ncbi:MAG: ankyrin repeat domain-containing protein, partial [Pirellulaceae bacterium]